MAAEYLRYADVTCSTKQRITGQAPRPSSLPLHRAIYRYRHSPRGAATPPMELHITPWGLLPAGDCGVFTSHTSCLPRMQLLGWRLARSAYTQVETQERYLTLLRQLEQFRIRLYLVLYFCSPLSRATLQ